MPPMVVSHTALTSCFGVADSQGRVACCAVAVCSPDDRASIAVKAMRQRQVLRVMLMCRCVLLCIMLTVFYAVLSLLVEHSELGY